MWNVQLNLQYQSKPIDIMRVALEPEAIRRVPRALALRHDILTLSADENHLLVALPEESDHDAVDRVRLATGMNVRVVHAPREQIRARLEAAYPGDLQRADAPAVAAVGAIHSAAINARASDVHLEPSELGGRVRQRVDGVLTQTQTLPQELFEQIVSRLKILAGMDIADRRQPQDGRYRIDGFERPIDARVSSMPTINGEKLAIRLLDLHGSVPRLDQLGMLEAQERAVRRSLALPHGFVVVCGPTGSGKTTTLYAAISGRDARAQNLCSIEDPVEIRVPGITQVQVNVRAGVTFASALRAFLRQDPDAVMIGELRDEDTAAVAASASLNGQLMLTSLHSADAPTAIERLAELGVSRRTLAGGLSLIVAQRLIRLLCGDCRKPQGRFFAAQGCERCGGSGYRGRTALFEVLVMNDELRTAVARGVSAMRFKAEAGGFGYQPMAEHGKRLVDAGATSPEEMERVLASNIE